MLYQTDFYTGEIDYSKLLSEISVKLHGIVMKEIDSELSKRMHKKEYHPFSVFAVPDGDKLIIRVSVLSDDVKEILGVFTKDKKFKIFGMDRPLIITDSCMREPVAAGDVSEYMKFNHCRIGFVTPATFKSKGYFMCRPEPERYMYSVILKHNTFEDEYIDYEEFAEIFRECEYEEFEFQSNKYNVSGIMIPGITGYADLRMPRDKHKKELIYRVFKYASYSGIGGKTGMGMGGFTFYPF